MQDRKIRFSETLSGRIFLLTYFKTVPLSLFGFLFSCGDGLTYFAPREQNLTPKLHFLLALASQNNKRGWKS